MLHWPKEHVEHGLKLGYAVCIWHHLAKHLTINVHDIVIQVGLCDWQFSLRKNTPEFWHSSPHHKLSPLCPKPLPPDEHRHMHARHTVTRTSSRFWLWSLRRHFYLKWRPVFFANLRACKAVWGNIRGSEAMESYRGLQRWKEKVFNNQVCCLAELTNAAVSGRELAEGLSINNIFSLKHWSTCCCQCWNINFWTRLLRSEGTCVRILICRTDTNNAPSLKLPAIGQRLLPRKAFSKAWNQSQAVVQKSLRPLGFHYAKRLRWNLCPKTPKIYCLPSFNYCKLTDPLESSATQEEKGQKTVCWERGGGREVNWLHKVTLPCTSTTISHLC